MSGDTEKYLNALYDGVAGFIDIRLIVPDGVVERIIAADIPHAADIVARSGALNVHPGIATRQNAGLHKGDGGKGNLSACKALWVDVDFNAPGDNELVKDLLATFPIPPSMLVESGGGQHLYWLLRESFDLTTESSIEEFENALKGLADYFGGDFAATDASRVLRVPGTTNYPNARKVATGRVEAPCKLSMIHEERRYSFDQFDDIAVRGAAYVKGKLAPIEYDSEEFDRSLPVAVQAALDAKRPNASPCFPKLIARWKSNPEELGVGASASELDMSIANLLAAADVEAADIENALRWRRREYGEKAKHTGYYRLTVGKAMARAELQRNDQSRSTSSGQADKGRPSIQLGHRQPREEHQDMVEAIVKANATPSLFRRGDAIVRVGRNDFGVGFSNKVLLPSFADISSQAANFWKQPSRGGPTPTRPSKDINEAVMAKLISESRLPLLKTVSPSPIIHEDGSLVTEEGFDQATGIYFAPSEGFKLGHVPDHPNYGQAKKAWLELNRPFSDMPFSTDSDRANFFALLITSVIRTWFPNVPFVVLEAPIQGSGKTLLAMAVRTITEGNAGIGAAPENDRGSDAEWRKRITSVLLKAPSIHIFDNVTGRLGGAALAALSTSPIWSDRLLSTNHVPDLPNTATWIFTSNNASVDADLLRRCMFVRLDPRSGSPHLRADFEIPDLIRHLLAHRGEILAHVYTLIRYWIERGKPDAPVGTPTFGSFEAWSEVVPAILGAVDVRGVLGDLDDRRYLMRDPDDEEAIEFMEAWHNNPRLRSRASAKELISCSLPIPSTAFGRDGLPNPRALGQWLHYRRDKVFEMSDAVSFVVRPTRGSSQKRKLWKVERIETGISSHTSEPEEPGLF